MKCPYCGKPDTKVVDSRVSDDGSAVRRRRLCETCGGRVTTFERVEDVPLMVVKKNGALQAYDRAKIFNGILRSCDKRKITPDALEKAVDDVEAIILNTPRREIASYEIGAAVMDVLKEVDEVAYVRFASVYRQFKDIASFMDELKGLLKEK